MKSFNRELRLWIVSILVGWVCAILPKDESAKEYWIWMSKMPVK